MNADHLRMILESEADTAKFWRLAQDLARAAIPEEILDVRLGRLTSLAKPSGGIRGIVCGDIVCRLVATTMAQQLAPTVERATSPFQCALTTRTGGECIAHALQAFTDLDDRTTVLSIDGIGAFDLISRGAMLNGLRSMDGGAPFRVAVLWEPVTHEMPYALCMQSKLRLDERLFAFLDDIYVVCRPERFLRSTNSWRRICGVTATFRSMQVRRRSGIQEDQMGWTTFFAQVADPDARVWFGDHALPLVERRIRV